MHARSQTDARCCWPCCRNYKLGRDLHSRDRELAKLVMRVVSLQEILNNHRHMPITRYTSYGFAHTLL